MTDRKRCAAKKRDGTQCKRYAVTGSKNCSIHGGKTLQKTPNALPTVKQGKVSKRIDVNKLTPEKALDKLNFLDNLLESDLDILRARFKAEVQADIEREVKLKYAIKLEEEKRDWIDKQSTFREDLIAETSKVKNEILEYREIVKGKNAIIEELYGQIDALKI